MVKNLQIVWNFFDACLKKYETLAGRTLIRDALREHMLLCADFETGFETFFQKLFLKFKKVFKKTLIFNQKLSPKTVTTG